MIRSREAYFGLKASIQYVFVPLQLQAKVKLRLDFPTLLMTVYANGASTGDGIIGEHFRDHAKVDFLQYPERTPTLAELSGGRQLQLPHY